MTAKEERAYSQGYTMMARQVISTCLGALRRENGNSLEVQLASLKMEMADIRAKLREVCEDFGDNDWDDNLCLDSVIEKHLANHLWAARDTGKAP